VNEAHVIKVNPTGFVTQIASFTLATLPAPVRSGQLANVTDADPPGVYLADGSEWILVGAPPSETPPVDVGASAATGSAIHYARADHRHAHGARSVGSDHAVADVSKAGFVPALSNVTRNYLQESVAGEQSWSPLRLPVTAMAGLDTSAEDGQLALVTDDVGGVWIREASTWHPLNPRIATEISIGVMDVFGCSGAKIPDGSTVVDFSNGVAGQQLAVYSIGNCTISETTSIETDGGEGLPMAAGDTALFFQFTAGVWRQIA
jgi:hypothetical protein